MPKKKKTGVEKAERKHKMKKQTIKAIMTNYEDLDKFTANQLLIGLPDDYPESEEDWKAWIEMSVIVNDKIPRQCRSLYGNVD